MNFNELDTKMRVFETSGDTLVIPEAYIIARLDGRSFTKLTKKLECDKPYDILFRDCMVDTTKYLMRVGFDVVYGYTQSDEISLLLNFDTKVFNRKTRKLISVLAGEASAKFSSLTWNLGVFDCRLSVLPNKSLVDDYFYWRMEDATRNCLNSYCFYTLINEGNSPKEAASILLKKSVSYKNNFLFDRGINFNDIPVWQKRGVGVKRVGRIKEGFNPITKEKVGCYRTKLEPDYCLPLTLGKINYE